MKETGIVGIDYVTRARIHMPVVYVNFNERQCNEMFLDLPWMSYPCKEKLDVRGDLYFRVDPNLRINYFLTLYHYSTSSYVNCNCYHLEHGRLTLESIFPSRAGVASRVLDIDIVDVILQDNTGMQYAASYPVEIMKEAIELFAPDLCLKSILSKHESELLWVIAQKDGQLLPEKSFDGINFNDDIRFVRTFG